MALYGIDISKWQGTISGQDFTIIKATEGVGYTDPTCDIKYQASKASGKLLGVYHFARPDGNSANAEAEWFVSQIRGYIGEAILVLDWETNPKTNVAWAKQWLDRVFELTGVRPLIYMSASVIRSADWTPVVQANYGLWVAGYPDKYNVKNPPVPADGEMPYNISPWAFAAIWQYTSSAGTLDRDIAFMSREAWGKYAANQNAPQIVTPPTPPTPQPTPVTPEPVVVPPVTEPETPVEEQPPVTSPDAPESTEDGGTVTDPSQPPEDPQTPENTPSTNQPKIDPVVVAGIASGVIIIVGAIIELVKKIKRGEIKMSFSKQNLIHLAKVFGFIAVSVVIAELPALFTGNQLYLTLAPAINVILVAIKEALTERE